MQATCDARRRFLDVEIRHPGSTSDYLAFAVSSLHHKMEGNNPHANNQPFLKPGLALYGDNAYVNTPYMAIPFKSASTPSKDAYNFYHSSLRIHIECAFGMLVHRWGILRKSIPMNIDLRKTNALVMALCRLHNFCIDENEAITKPTASDTLDIALHGGIDLRAFQNIDQDDGDFVYDNDRDRIDHLIDGGNHPHDVPNNVRRQQYRLIENMHQPNPLPFQVMHNYVEEQGFRRPTGGRRVR
jgi:DDE superfamily endonuclease